jgi:hypothetical protein
VEGAALRPGLAALRPGLAPSTNRPERPAPQVYIHRRTRASFNTNKHGSVGIVPCRFGTVKRPRHAMPYDAIMPHTCENRPWR